MAGELGVKSLGVAAVALVLGFVLGGLGPSGKLRAAEDRIFALEKEAGRGERAGTELARMIASGIREGRDAPTFGGAGASAAADDTDAGPKGVVGARGVDSDGTTEDAAERRASVETLQETLVMRSRLARQALVDEAGATDAQLEQIDQVYDEMNDDLLDLSRRISQSLRANGGKEPSRRELLSFGAEGLGVLADAEADVLATLDADQRAELSDEATDPASFVSPEVIETLRQLDEADGAP